MRKKGQSQNIFLRIITIPLRALVKARDIYVKSITTCGDNMGYNNPVDAVGRFSGLPRSYSAATSARSMENNEDFAELIRAASARTLVNRIDVDNLVEKNIMAREGVGANGLAKSTSVGMARIDEDMACDLGKECGVSVPVPVSYPRSRSYAV